MRKKCLALLLVSVFALFSCRDKPSRKDVAKLNGYWEIAEVKTLDGPKKEFQFNEFIDFIQLKKGSGFRKKVRPLLDGRYETTSPLFEKLNVKDSADAIWLAYETPYRKWSEKLLELDADHFTVQNAEGIAYTYKRQQAFSVK